jgi:SAM-dependent methyltransferase
MTSQNLLCALLVDVADDDPVTGREFLTRSAYADDRHLRSRQAIWAYAEKPLDLRGRTASVDWDGTQVVADVGCGNGIDLRSLIAEGKCRRVIGLDVSAGMLGSLAGIGSGQLALLQADAQRLPLPDASVDVALAMHMLYHVPDIGAAVGELRRVVRPGGTVLASTNSSHTLGEINGLFAAALSAQLGRPMPDMFGLSFSTESGAGLLEPHFREVSLRVGEGALVFPSAEPVLAYLGSVREPILRQLGAAVDFDAALDEVATRIEEVIRADGSFRATARSGVFTCR